MRIVVPWRPEPARIPMFEYTYARLQKNYDVHLSDFPSKTFSRAASRNYGVSSSYRADESIVVLLDADTLVTENALEAAVSHVEAYGGVAIPFDTYKAMSAESTELFLSGAPLEELPFKVVKKSTGGAIVTTVDAWWECGGQDERFRGWGYEDTAWRLAADLISPPVIFPGDAWAGGHPTTDRGGLETRRNRQLFQQYKLVRKDEARMRELLADPARFPITG